MRSTNLRPHLFGCGRGGEQVFDTAKNLGVSDRMAVKRVRTKYPPATSKAGLADQPRKPRADPPQLHPDGDNASRTGFAPHGVGLIQHVSRTASSSANRAAVPPTCCMVIVRSILPSASLFFEELRQIVALATPVTDHGPRQGWDDGCSPISVRRAAGPSLRSVSLHPASRISWMKGDHARRHSPCLHPSSSKVVGDFLRAHPGRAIHVTKSPMSVCAWPPGHSRRVDPDAHKLCVALWAAARSLGYKSQGESNSLCPTRIEL